MKNLLGIVAVLSIGMVSCRNIPEDTGKPVVGVSILPQQYFIDRIAGNLVEVLVMIPPGASPATYEPTIGQLSKLSRASSYMRIGYVEFELSWMDKIISTNPDMKITDLSRNIVPIDDSHQDDLVHSGHVHEGIDPHIWMSLVNAKFIAKNTFEALSSLLPAKKDLLHMNLEKLLVEIDSLHSQISTMLLPYQSRGFMIYHPSLTYFARDYNLNQYPLEIGGKTPSPAHLKRMVDLGVAQHISAIFVQQQFDIRNAEVLASEIGAEIIRFDPLDPDWYSQMKYIADQLKRSM
jgi:zinc transport system substrate-binding protein